MPFIPNGCVAICRRLQPSLIWLQIKHFVIQQFTTSRAGGFEAPFLSNRELLEMHGGAELCNIPVNGILTVFLGFQSIFQSGDLDMAAHRDQLFHNLPFLPDRFLLNLKR